MRPVRFSAYAINACYHAQLGPVPFEHTFVITETGADWNCWGRGKDTIGKGARELPASGLGLEPWAKLAYGDASHPTGLEQDIEGVCQHASNRILLLAGTDVSEANGNIYATLLYGKYGFNVGNYIKTLKETAAQLNDQESNAISEATLEEVVSRIGHNPEDELKLLESHFLEALPPSLPTSQSDQLLESYNAFQKERETIFQEEWQNRTTPGFQGRFAQRIQPLFVTCLHNFCHILGREQYETIFQSQPEEIIIHLLRL